jgi:hypothetical protein
LYSSASGASRGVVAPSSSANSRLAGIKMDNLNGKKKRRNVQHGIQTCARGWLKGQRRTRQPCPILFVAQTQSDSRVLPQQSSQRRACTIQICADLPCLHAESI